MKKQLTLIWVFIMVLLLITPGCKKKGLSLSPEDMGSDKEIYEKAKKRIKRAPEKARLLFKEVMHLYPDSIYARRAKIGIADSYFRQKDAGSLIMAATEYQEYVNLYPNSPDAVYAKYQISRCYIRQSKSPGRDQTNTHLAIKALESMIRQYPDTNEAEEAKKQLERVRQRLAAHYFSIGLTNYKLKAYKGAIDRFKQVIDDYPDFKNNDKLFYYTGKCYFAVKAYNSAISFFQQIVNTYPKSKYLKKATKMIKEITGIQAKIKKKEKLAQRDKK
ncbi:MAG: outer membrane protein assembly factor BamD [Candidatus Aminicenantes bacterium]|nr:MAG: outer membrane protein assembly factor BamD [Candidatus Aminicenantes bacterium]